MRPKFDPSILPREKHICSLVLIGSFQERVVFTDTPSRHGPGAAASQPEDRPSCLHDHGRVTLTEQPIQVSRRHFPTHHLARRWEIGVRAVLSEAGSANVVAHRPSALVGGFRKQRPSASSAQLLLIVQERPAAKAGVQVRCMLRRDNDNLYLLPWLPLQMASNITHANKIKPKLILQSVPRCDYTRNKVSYRITNLFLISLAQQTYKCNYSYVSDLLQTI